MFFVNNLILNKLNDDPFYTNNLIMKTFAQFLLKIMHSLFIIDFEVQKYGLVDSRMGFDLVLKSFINE
jgi:hypothetical protein